MIRSALAASLTMLALSTASTAFAAEKTAILAGGCFWCIETDFEKVAGVIDVVSGYTGGSSQNPTYKTHGKDGHREAVKITYDDSKVSYSQLLDIFWRTVDPTDGGGQFCDRGFSYSTAIYALDQSQLEAAKKSKKQIESSGLLSSPIMTEIALAAPFTNAEDYHQDYHHKNPARYKYYRWRCGRDQSVKALWGKEAYKGVGKAGS